MQRNLKLCLKLGLKWSLALGPELLTTMLLNNNSAGLKTTEKYLPNSEGTNLKIYTQPIANEDRIKMFVDIQLTLKQHGA